MQLLLTQNKMVDIEPKFLVRDYADSCSYFKKMNPIRPSQAYDTYWLFAYERQNVFFNKLTGKVRPWTADPIISNYKFTNAYRASDRVSQFLIRNVIYSGPQDPNNVFFRTILFKLFNRIETWLALEKLFGCISIENFNFDKFNDALGSIIGSGKAIYSGAYIMPSGQSRFGHARKHSNHLALLEKMIDDDLPNKIQHSKGLREVFELLCCYHSIGSFLAYQFAIDLNYSSIINYSENEFVVPGPGALSGIAKCFDHLGGLTEYEIIKFMVDRQHSEFKRLGIDFKTLWGRDLTMIDCQNLFCEVDKYSRLALPHLNGLGKRKRIKQKYAQNHASVNYWFPPKWGINDKIISS